MRVQTEEWQRFIPGVRMYKGKKTLFYNGEKLYDKNDVNRRWQIYNWNKRRSWEVIIVLPGVEVIPEDTFYLCENVKTVIMSDTVRRIEQGAFSECKSLKNVRLSRNLEYIGKHAFFACWRLASIFIPPSYQEIRNYAFEQCGDLIILVVPQHTQLGYKVICLTPLNETSPFRNLDANATENDCIKNINGDDKYELHRACTSFNPLENILIGILKRQGLGAFRKPNAIGITPLQYLEANPYADIDQYKLMKRYIAEMMGETI